MRCKQYLTELKLDLSFPTHALTWLAAASMFGTLYGLRAIHEFIPPEEHVAFTAILCALLSQVLFNLEQTSLTIRLDENRCWLRHYRFGKKRETSIPVSQIHSAKLEYASGGDRDIVHPARIVLITSLGMIPVNEEFQADSLDLDDACRRINGFLASQVRFMLA